MTDHNDRVLTLLSDISAALEELLTLHGATAQTNMTHYQMGAELGRLAAHNEHLLDIIKRRRDER